MARSIRTIEDPGDLRALAHPLRLRLLGALRLDGPATASELARRFGVSSGLTSYHLRALAERGFVEDDPGRDGRRERWWRACHDAHAWAVAPEEPERRRASRDLTVQVARVYGRRIEEWAASADHVDERWEAAGTYDWWLRLSPARLSALVDELHAVVERYEQEAGDDDVERIAVLLAAFPEPPRA